MIRAILSAIVCLFLSAPVLSAPVGSKRACVDLTSGGSVLLIDGLDMTTSRTFSYDGPNSSGGYDLVVLFLSLTDANASITTFRTECTVSANGNTTDYVPQSETISSGVATQVDAGVWHKASPGTKNWPVRIDMAGYPDFECTFSVQAGSGAGIDLLTMRGRACVEGGQ